MAQVAVASSTAVPAVTRHGAWGSSIKVEPLTCAIGAELTNVNLGDALRDDACRPKSRSSSSSIRFRSCATRTSPGRARCFAPRFGQLEDHPVVGSDPEHPVWFDMTRVRTRGPSRMRTPTTATRRGGSARSSGPCCVGPEAPAVGGDMIWVSMALAYERLPEHIKAQIAGLRARHSIEATFGAAMPIEKRLALKAQYPDAEHPVVRTHPETGEKILFVNAFTTHFTNFHTPENVRLGQDFAPGSSLLLNYLISQAYVPEYQVRWRLRKNSVAIWDNRCTQHYAVQDFWPAVRNLERAGIIGDRPV